MGKDFKLLMISAMYENGGNTTHRFLDGHHQMFVYPFESQLGTKFVSDQFSSMFPLKYRWPVFPQEGNSQEDYRLIIDEEVKVRARTSHVSKFRDVDFKFSDDERLKIYKKYIHDLGRSQTNNIEAFFKSTFDAWKNHASSSKEEIYVGYSPIIVIDADKIFESLPSAHILHVVRNPWSAYADTKKRPVPLSLEDYTLRWNLNQYFALLYKKTYPKRMHIVRLEDVLEDSCNVLSSICKEIGLEGSESLKNVSFNGKNLKEVYPWGTIRNATPEANKNTALELSTEEQENIKDRTSQYIEAFNYSKFIS